MPAPPVIIVPDTTPLIYLAAGNLLDVLLAAGRVVIPDVVVLEATRRLDKPWASEIAAWMKTAAVEIAPTDLGVVYRAAVAQNIKPPRHAGEYSIMEWLRANLATSGERALIVAEDARVPRLLAIERFGDRATALTTDDFLEFAAQAGIMLAAKGAKSESVRPGPTDGPALPHDPEISSS